MRTLILVVLFMLAGCATTGGHSVDKSTMAQGYYEKGLAYFQQKNYELASVEFNRSIQTDKYHKWSYYMLGIISNIRGRLDESEDYFKKAIKADKKFSEAYNALGEVYSKQQKWDDALKCYQKALDNKLYPTPHFAYLNIGLVYMAKKDYPNAVEAFRSAKQYASQDAYWGEIVLDLGSALVEEGKTKEAIEELREGTALEPQNARLRYGLAQAYLKDGNKKSAIQEFRKVKELDPDSDLALKANDYLKTLR